MRKIEIAMCAAIRARRDWVSGNTAVELRTRQDGKPLAEIALYRNHIATVGYIELMGAAAGPAYHVVSLTVSLAGWNTATTRSRLSAIIREFVVCGPSGLGVSTRGGSRDGRDGQASLHDANGKRDIDDRGWHVVALHKGANDNG